VHTIDMKYCKSKLQFCNTHWEKVLQLIFQYFFHQVFLLLLLVLLTAVQIIGTFVDYKTPIDLPVHKNTINSVNADSVIVMNDDNAM